MRIIELFESAAWQKSSGKNKNGGLNKKGVASYRREHPGSKLQTAVTTKPNKLKKGSKAAKRRKSFCARMKGMKKHRTGAKTKRDPNSRINKSLRKWHCESIQELQELVMITESYLAEKTKQRLDAKCWTGKHKEGTKMKGGIRVNNCVPNESVEEASNSTVDMTGKKCEKCKKGTYQETGMHDDMDGVLHCTKCGTEVKRHPQRHRNIKAKESVEEAANAAQQAAIAIAKKKEKNVDENFADGKGPGRPGDSARHGIPKHATKAELEKASHAKGRKGQLARWQLNMRNGKKN